ncbi:MAG: hypothetical protein MZW92_35115, partial [Comamonadaceae bacterium]|nr:hypothetical protein [Comamonadaceae bacterium]
LSPFSYVLLRLNRRLQTESTAPGLVAWSPRSASARSPASSRSCCRATDRLVGGAGRAPRARPALAPGARAPRPFGAARGALGAVRALPRRLRLLAARAGGPADSRKRPGRATDRAGRRARRRDGDDRRDDACRLA